MGPLLNMLGCLREDPTVFVDEPDPLCADIRGNCENKRESLVTPEADDLRLNRPCIWKVDNCDYYNFASVRTASIEFIS